MSYTIIQRLGILASSMLLLHAPLGAKKCKTFGSLVIRCALTTGQLTVNGNANITGNLTIGGTITSTGAITSNGSFTVNGNEDITGNLNVGGVITSTGVTTNGNTTISGSENIAGSLIVGGTITTPSGSLGDLFAYGSWVNDDNAGPLAPGADVPFPLQIAPTTGGQITANGPGTRFTVNLAGTYLIAYQITGTVSTPTPTFDLEFSTDGGASFNHVAGGQVQLPVTSVPTDVLEASNLVIVPNVAAGTQFQILVDGGTVSLVSNQPTLSNSAAITFIRIHA